MKLTNNGWLRPVEAIFTNWSHYDVFKKISLLVSCPSLQQQTVLISQFVTELQLVALEMPCHDMSML
jgi:hypothetical protein